MGQMERSSPCKSGTQKRGDLHELLQPFGVPHCLNFSVRAEEQQRDPNDLTVIELNS